MNLVFNVSLAAGFSSRSQTARATTENWALENLYCPSCGAPSLRRFPNNAPVADFFCPECDENFELKSKNGRVGRKIVDGAYQTALERIQSASNPNLFVLEYNDAATAVNLTITPKFFFVSTTLEKRPPLKATARRAGWIGCNILFSEIPTQGKIDVIRNSRVVDRDDVLAAYSRSRRLQFDNLEKRGWALDVLNCVNAVATDVFELKDVYAFADVLQKKYANNHHIEAKIRQQLQALRDKGFLLFLGNGKYQKIR